MLRAESISYQDLIHEISLEFHPGTLYGILGPNGSGKSTFLKALAGIWRPTSGQVMWKGEELLKKERREISKIISLVPQYATIPFDYTTTELVSMGRYSHDTRETDLIEWSLKLVDAWHLRNRKMNHLSHGERQRIYIARALITESPILLLDEPASSLDIHHQLQIWELLTKLKEQDKVIIIANHDLVATERFCDAIALLNHGHCIATGTFDATITPDILNTVFAVQESETHLSKAYMLGLKNAVENDL